MKALQTGVRRSEEIVPGPGHTASAVGNAGIDVVATTALILFIEEVSTRAVEHCLEAGEATVGVRVEVDHLAPARVGHALTVSCELVALKGRRLVFSSEVHQADTLVMKGGHHRVVVARERFMAGASARPGRLSARPDSDTIGPPAARAGTPGEGRQLEE